MDYTTITRLKLEKSIKEVTDDSLLSLLITAASRDVDRYCTGTAGPESDNYFQTGSVNSETLAAWLDSDGNITSYLHKPQVISVTSMAYKILFNGTYTAIDRSLIEVPGGPIVVAHILAPVLPQKCWILTTYAGGLGLTTADLPADFVEAVTEDAIRLYLENKAGLADAIGTVETGIMTYTKAMPVRIQRMLEPYRRIRPWREA